MFKKMLSAMGIGAPEVDTVLATTAVAPGGKVIGEVHVTGGEVDVEIDYISLGLTTRVESEQGDHEWKSNIEFFRVEVARAFKLGAKERRTVPFEFTVPWETPVTEVYGQHLHGMTMGVRTELAIAKAADKGDLDAISITPLPSQLRILEAFESLGFQFKGADLEQGRLHGVRQTLPFFQEIEFYPPHHVHGINEVEVTFVANPHALEVILEVDSRGGFLSGGGDTYRRLTIEHATADQTDWTREIDAWIKHAASFAGSHGYGGPGHGSHGHGHRRGPGMGAVAGGAAAGFLGGMVAGEMLEGFFGDD